MAFLVGSLQENNDFLIGSLVFNADVLAPSFTGGLTLVTSDSESVTVGYSVDEASDVFFIVVPRNAQIPKPSEIIAGVDYSNVIVAGAGNESVNGGDDEQFQITSLSPDVEYTIYAVPRDQSLNVGGQSAVRSINFTTDAVFVPTPPVMPDDETVLVTEGVVLVGRFAAISGSGVITYSISGVDADKFVINAASGDVSFINTPDVSSPDDANGDGDYILTVTANNADGSDSVSLTVRLISTDRPSTDFIVKSEERLLAANLINIDYYPELHPPIVQRLGDAKLYIFDFSELLGSTVIDAKQVTLTGATNKGEFIQGQKIGVYVEGLYANVVACLNVQAISSLSPALSITSTVYLRFK